MTWNSLSPRDATVESPPRLPLGLLGMTREACRLSGALSLSLASVPTLP